jgi:hypothetical protein
VSFLIYSLAHKEDQLDDHFKIEVHFALHKVAGHVASTFVRQAGAMVVDRFDRKLINFLIYNLFSNLF